MPKKKVMTPIEKTVQELAELTDSQPSRALEYLFRMEMLVVEADSMYHHGNIDKTEFPARIGLAIKCLSVTFGRDFKAALDDYYEFGRRELL